MTKKLLFLGRAGVGKTTIKEIIFEGKDPKTMLEIALQPTRGIETSDYSWLDLELVIFDTSGQELPNLITDEKESLRTFSDADAVIYILDYNLWHNFSLEISDEINAIYNIAQKNSQKAKFIVLVHKIDLIPEEIRNNLRIFMLQLQNLINLPVKSDIYFTSIAENYMYSLQNAISEILCSLSKETLLLKEILNRNLELFPESIGFITDQNKNMIIQSKSQDFNVNMIYESYRIFYHITKDDKAQEYKDGEPYLIYLHDKFLRMIKKKLFLRFKSLDSLVCASKALNQVTIEKLVNKILIDLLSSYPK
ncbi:MAG: ADP-ribosylation factor-like protein [Promethearchaeota archaeon]